VVLVERQALRPARPAFDAAESFRRWSEIVSLRPQVRATTEHELVDVVIVERGSRDALERCLAALERQSSSNFQIHVAATREAGVQGGSAPYVLLLEEGDVPDAEMLETLLAAQAATDADVVSCGVRLDGEEDSTLHLFAGEPGGLGALANGYGTVALFRRDAFAETRTAWPPRRDAQWPLLAAHAAAGATVVSVPTPLVTRSARIGSVADDPEDALLAVHELERALPEPARGAARLAAGLAAHARAAQSPQNGGGVVNIALKVAAALRRLSGAHG
jgi:hypothetical protein